MIGKDRNLSNRLNNRYREKDYYGLCERFDRRDHEEARHNSRHSKRFRAILDLWVELERLGDVQVGHEVWVGSVHVSFLVVVELFYFFIEVCVRIFGLTAIDVFEHDEASKTGL